jgi:multimeric flavodoxin WrbA
MLQAGKAASMFTSTASQGSGQETTIMTAVTQLAHHGMIYVPTGYGSGGAMFGLDAAKVGCQLAVHGFMLLSGCIPRCLHERPGRKDAQMCQHRCMVCRAENCLTALRLHSSATACMAFTILLLLLLL